MGQTRALLLPGATDLQSPGCLQSSDIAGMCKVPGIAPGKEGQQRGREGCNCEVQGAARGNPRPGASGRPDALTPGLACPPRFSILPQSAALKACLFPQRHVCRGPPGGQSGPCSAPHGLVPLRRAPKDHCVTLITASPTGAKHHPPSPFRVRDLSYSPLNQHRGALSTPFRQHGGALSTLLSMEECSSAPNKPGSEEAVHTKIQTEFCQQCASHETTADCPTLDHLSFPHLIRGSTSQPL